MRALGPAVLLLLLVGCSDPFRWPEPQPAEEPQVLRGDLTLEPFATGFEQPILLLAAPDGTLLVVEQTGRVWPLVNGTRGPEPYLDLVDRVGLCHHEQGLLGLAFSPRFAEDRRLFVTYTDKPCGTGEDDPNGDLRLVRFTVPENASRPDPASERVLLRLEKPYRNHNGGHLVFGPDGMLYMGIGDGGSHGDPKRNGQDTSTLLGKILRLDVSGDTYASPPDNPFVGKPGRDEIWVYGLRNPWRFTFDNATGDLWIADVGQDTVEEVDRLPNGSAAGANLGWSLYEGDRRFRGGSAPAGLVAPVATYRHGDRHCSVTGGPVLRGTDLTGLEGAFLFGDFCSGRVWAVVPSATGGWRMEALLDSGLQVTSFGQDGEGNVYILHWAGEVRRLVAVAPSATPTTQAPTTPPTPTDGDAPANTTAPPA